MYNQHSDDDIKEEVERILTSMLKPGFPFPIAAYAGLDGKPLGDTNNYGLTKDDEQDPIMEGLFRDMAGRIYRFYCDKDDCEFGDVEAFTLPDSGQQGNIRRITS